MRLATSKQAVQELAKATAGRLGVERQARYLYAMRTAAGRRGYRDDRRLAFLLAALLAPGSNCVDVGAHRGAILADMVRLAPGGRHLACEPLPAFAAKLRERFPRVEVHACAVSDADGETPFHIGENPELSGIRQRGWVPTSFVSELTVPVRTLDSLVPDGRIVDFVKIDVEGAQVLVLRGAERILASCRPALWIEHDAPSAAVHGTSTQDLWDVLSGHGYRIWTADGDGPLDLPALLASGEDTLMWTYLAHC